MRIWLVHHGEPFPDPVSEKNFRSHRLAKELAKRGHEVVYWKSTFDHHRKTLLSDKATNKFIDGYRIRLVHAGRYTSNHSFGRLIHHIRFAIRLYREFKTAQLPDVIVCSVPIHYCAFFAIRFGKQKGIPVVLDIRDYWPDTLIFALPRIFHGFAKSILFFDRWIMRYAISRATGVVSMMKSLLGWGLSEFGDRDACALDRVFFIGSDPQNEKTVSSTPALAVPSDFLKSRIIVNYVGTFTHMTHPTLLIEAARRLTVAGLSERFCFLLVGEGDYYQRCVQAADGLNNVFFLGWRDAREIAFINSVSTIGVIPSYEEFSFPNKTFSYLSAGLPILTSDRGELRSFLEQYNAGSWFDIRSVDSLVERLIWLSEMDAESRSSLARGAKSLFTSEFNAEKIYSEYAEYLESIVSNHELPQSS